MKEEALSQVINKICRICNNEFPLEAFVKNKACHNFTVISAKDNQRKTNKYEQPD